jgi:tetratricopeptide (TPR) repeat protein
MDDRIEEALRHMDAGASDKAERVLLGLLEEHPEDTRSNYLMASLCEQRGQERRAVPFYRRALVQFEGLYEEELASAYLGLGSTYRVLGEYEASLETLQEGIEHFPGDRTLSTFLALTLYNLGEHRDATSILLKNLIETTGDPDIRNYGRAITFYADHLDEKFG